MLKRVVLFSHNSNLSGAPISISQLARKLPELGYSPLLILPKHGPLEQKLVTWGVEYSVLRRGCAPLDFFRIVRRERPLLIHVNSLVKTWPVIVSRLLGLPVIWHVREHLGGKRFYARIIHALAHRVILISQNQYKLFKGLKNAVLVFNGVDPDDFKEARPAKVMTSDDVSVVRVSYIGSIERRKGLITLVRAAALLNTDVPVQFVVVGDATDKNSAYREEIEAAIHENNMENKFQFLGQRQDIAEILAGSDILCHPAYIEEFGRVILEAMASKLPVIASRIGEIIEMVEDGSTGILVEAGNVEQLSAAVARLCTDAALRHEMGEKGFLRLSKTYSLNIHAGNVVNVYDSVLEEKQLTRGGSSSGVRK
jgi:glycosyltransferase involved in cell wall biosynthesis